MSQYLHEQSDDWFEDDDEFDLLPRRCRAPTTYRALLQVSKQVFQEAMPVFYGGNNFVFPTLERMLWFLERTPESRRNHVNHINFHYESFEVTDAARAFRFLKEISKLRKLDVVIGISLRCCIRPLWGSSSPQYSSLLEVPGIDTLGTVRGLKEVRFHADDGALSGLVGPMTKEKAEKTGSQAVVPRVTRNAKKRAGERPVEVQNA